MKTVKHYMKKKVVRVKPTDSIFDVAKVLSKKHISGVPVVDNGKMVGIISEADIIKFMKIRLPEVDFLAHEPHAFTIMVASFVKEGIEFIREAKKMAKLSVSDFMSKEIISIKPESSILEAAEVMEKNNVDRLPVTNGGKLHGIITRADLIRALLE